MLNEIANTTHMIHDKIHERHEFINKLRITSIHKEYINKHMNTNS